MKNMLKWHENVMIFPLKFSQDFNGFWFHSVTSTMYNLFCLPISSLIREISRCKTFIESGNLPQLLRFIKGNRKKRKYQRQESKSATLTIFWSTHRDKQADNSMVFLAN